MIYVYGVDGEAEASIPLYAASLSCISCKDGSVRVALAVEGGGSISLTCPPHWVKSHSLADFGRAARMTVRRAVRNGNDLSMEEFARELYEELEKSK